MQIPEPWWKTDKFDKPELEAGLNLNDPWLWGPEGPALVPYFEQTGKTGPGWGAETFMENYRAHKFNYRRILYRYDQFPKSFAYVMRSTRAIAVDVDGKNDGFAHVTQLGYLPPTTAEISQSGNGQHIFYSTEDDWDPDFGFQTYPDVIGLVPGIDIRGTGCVFHLPSQRWNGRPLAPLPEHLKKMLLARKQSRTQERSNILKTLALQDPEETLLMQAQLIDELRAPIPNGRRNQTLFAIGSKMVTAGVEGWGQHIENRASQLGLDHVEIDKLLNNIARYTPSA